MGIILFGVNISRKKTMEMGSRLMDSVNKVMKYVIKLISGKMSDMF